MASETVSQVETTVVEVPEVDNGGVFTAATSVGSSTIAEHTAEEFGKDELFQNAG